MQLSFLFSYMPMQKGYGGRVADNRPDMGGGSLYEKYSKMAGMCKGGSLHRGPPFLFNRY